MSTSLDELFHHLYFELKVRPGDVMVPRGLDDVFKDWIEAEVNK